MGTQWSPDECDLDEPCCSVQSLTNIENDRVPIFNCYNTVNSKWHNWNPYPDHVAEMPTKRQTLFRPIHVAGNVIGGQYQD